MTRLAAFFHWVGTPIRAARALFPFTSDGRKSLIYLVFAGCGPALCLILFRVLDDTKAAGQWAYYAATAEKIGWALLIAVAALSTYVAWQSIKIGKDGLAANAREDGSVTMASPPESPAP